MKARLNAILGILLLLLCANMYSTFKDMVVFDFQILNKAKQSGYGSDGVFSNELAFESYKYKASPFVWEVGTSNKGYKFINIKGTLDFTEYVKQLKTGDLKNMVVNNANNVPDFMKQDIGMLYDYLRYEEEKFHTMLQNIKNSNEKYQVAVVYQMRLQAGTYDVRHAYREITSLNGEVKYGKFELSEFVEDKIPTPVKHMIMQKLSMSFQHGL